jgi:gas vesicle protein
MNTYPNEQLSHTKNPASFLAGVFIGGVAGALTMLFLAPQSGKETRQQIQQKAMDLRNQATTTVDTTLTQIRRGKGKGPETSRAGCLSSTVGSCL